MKFILLVISLLFLMFNSSAQDGRLISSMLLNIKSTPLWNIISTNDSIKSEYSFSNNLTYSEIIYESDSINVRGLKIEPKKEGKYPVIIFNRGGNRDFNALTLKMLFFSTAVLANEGYIILASNYRTQDEYGGDDINDVLNLIEVVDQIENADSSQIGMFGWSRGGMMTYLALKESKRIKTAVIGNGASDLFLSIKNRPNLEQNPISECIPNYWRNKEVELLKRSAYYWADSLDKESSLLLICGTLDKRVSYNQSVKMANKLDSINYDYELKTFETGHSFRGKKEELNNELILWFNKHLKE